MGPLWVPFWVPFLNISMISFKKFLLEKEQSTFAEVKKEVENTPGMSIGKRLVSRAGGAVSSLAGKGVGPAASIAQGDVMGTIFALGKNASPIGMAHTVLNMGKEANADPYPLESEMESQKEKDELLASAMNPQNNPVSRNAPVELRRAEQRRKTEEYFENK